MATQESGFFQGTEAVAPRNGFELLPTTRSAGAPREQKWLCQFVEDSVEVRHSGDKAKTPGHPYLSYSLAIVEPTEYANRRVFGMFYYGPEANPDATEEEIFNVKERQGNVKYMIDAILGEGTFESVRGATLEEALENIAPMLEEIHCVATIGFERGKGDYVGKDKNKVTFFDPADSWVNEDDE